MHIYAYFCAKFNDMIQRIQSIYIFIAFALTVAYLFMGMFIVTSAEEGYQALFSLVNGEPFPLDQVVYMSYALIALAGIEIIALVWAFFSYKNLKSQASLLKSAIWISVFIAVNTALLYFLIDKGGYEVMPLGGAINPVLILFADYLALRGVNKDRALLKSVDRIR